MDIRGNPSGFNQALGRIFKIVARIMEKFSVQAFMFVCSALLLGELSTGSLRLRVFFWTIGELGLHKCARLYQYHNLFLVLLMRRRLVFLSLASRCTQYSKKNIYRT